MTRLKPLTRSDQQSWLLVASGVSSISNFVLTGFGIRLLSASGFGSLSLLTAASLLCAGVVRASVAEVGYDSATSNGGLSVRRVWIAAVVALPLTAAVLVVQISLVSGSFSFVFPSIVFATVLAIAEVAKVRLVSYQRFGHVAVLEVSRLLLLVTLFVSLVPQTVGGILLLGALSVAPVIAGSVFGPPSDDHKIGLKDAVTAGIDVLVQRSGGQVAASVVFASSASTLGAISTARFAMAPLTTLYTSAASLALVGTSVMSRRVRRLLLGCLTAGVLYLGVLMLVVSFLPGGAARILGSDAPALDSMLLPIGLFAISGALGPVLSTSLRRLNLPMASLQARVGASVALVAIVSLFVFARGADDSPIGVAWAYATAGVVGAMFWIRSCRLLQQVAT